MKILLLSFIGAAFIVSCVYGAKCGSTEYFEYKLKPISVRPAGSDEAKAGKARCGESRCDFMIMIYGEDRCKSTGHEVIIRGPKNKNSVTSGEFTPASVGYSTHAAWRLSDASTQPFNVQLCDEDGFPRGRNDMLMHMNYNTLTQGCETVRQQDTNDPENPYIFEFEVCCRPVDSTGRGGSSSGSRRRGNKHRSYRDVVSAYAASDTSRKSHNYNLRNRDEAAVNDDESSEQIETQNTGHRYNLRSRDSHSRVEDSGEKGYWW